MQNFAATFTSAFQSSVGSALETFKTEVFSHEGIRDLHAAGAKPEHLAVLMCLFEDIGQLAKVLLRFDATQNMAAYLVGVAYKDGKYGLLEQKKQAKKQAALDHTLPLEFADGEAASIDPVGEAAADPALRAEREAQSRDTFEAIRAAAQRWAISDAAQDSSKNQPKRLEVYQTLVTWLLDGKVTRTQKGGFGLPVGQREIASMFGTNEVYIRNWLKDFRGHLDRFAETQV